MATDRIYGDFQTAGVKIATTGKSSVNSDGTNAYAQVFALIGGDGSSVGSSSNPIYVNEGGATYQLLSNASATGNPVTGILAGAYVWNVVGTFGGATVKLQALASDNATYQDITGASMTAGGSIGVVLGSNAAVKAVVTGGAPSGLYSNLS